MNLYPAVEIDEVICLCYQVNESTIRNAIAKNDLKDIDAVTGACDAGGGCHSCHILIQLFIDQYLEKTTVMEDLVKDHAQKVKKKGLLTGFFEKF